MKIGMVGTDIFAQGKVNLVDERIKILKTMFNSAKEVYLQVDIVTEEAKILEVDGIIAPESAKLDLIVHDLEFVETRLSRSTDDNEKNLLNKFKVELDKENFLTGISLSEEEKKSISGYSLWSIKPIFLAKQQDLEDKNKLLMSAYAHFGYISFFTAGEKDAHGWSIRKGITAYEAAGAIHSDIQKGFIRAEVINFQELVNDGGLSKARSSNHLRLESKDYIVQDADYLLIRTNK
jgi:hypothetical protein